MDRPLLCVLKKKGSSFFLFQSFQNSEYRGRSSSYSAAITRNLMLFLHCCASSIAKKSWLAYPSASSVVAYAFTGGAVLSVTTKKKLTKKANGDGVLHDGKQQLVQVLEAQEAEEEALAETQRRHGSWLWFKSNTLEWNQERGYWWLDFKG
ncbi:unnamed protein product [Sphagnum jensenii]|uniref:Uncharacterized protein n=1 Tax=Sphagnum jensenii TaxID=128206 RepID=A0ABP1BRJ4_9BRYO